jgi:hypothetical protein
MAIIGIVRSFARAIARSAARNNAKSSLRSSAIRSRGFRTQLGVRTAELVEEAAELEQRAGDIIEAAYYEAIDTMQGMIGNAGQQTVFNDHVIPAFADGVATTSIQEGWDDIDIGEYMSFMGEIVAEGNAIMSAAYDEAQSLAAEAEDIESEIEENEESLEAEELEEALNRA